MQKFQERLNYLLNGRKITPFIRVLGFSRGVTEHINKGSVPGSEVLIAICRTENVSLNWLLEDIGAPFLIDTCDSDSELAEHLEAHINIEGSIINLIHDGPRLVVELSHPVEYLHKDKPVKFMYREYLTGPVGNATRNLLLDKYQQNPDRWQESYLNSEYLDVLRIGFLGPFSLYGDKKIPGKLEPLSLDTKDDLIRILDACYEPEPAGEVSMDLMRAVITQVDETAMIENIILSVDQRARTYTSAYRHAQRKGLAPKDLDSSNILSLLEVLK
ncbi:MAG: hypothetical protein ACR2PX_01085 [Endozoicomonas sp.]|uniref:hypothetical protein n=1 Tax=Endozoicomonas sp. TaxID=1892382 RepID=UPI003D9ADB67